MTTLPARRDVWWCEIAEIGRRPVIVLSRDAVISRPADTRMRQICGALAVAVDCAD